MLRRTLVTVSLTIAAWLSPGAAHASSPDCKRLLNAKFPDIASEIARSRLQVVRQDIHVACSAPPSRACEAVVTFEVRPLEGGDTTTTKLEARYSPEFLEKCPSTPKPMALRHLLFSQPERDEEATIPILSTSPPRISVDGAVSITSVSKDTVYIKHHIGMPPLRQGGPFVGVGSTRDKRGDARVRARVGYEIARPTWLVHSLSVESDFRSIVLAPAIELAETHPWFGVFTIGGGVPVRFFDTSAVGVRAQAGLAFPILGIFGTVDYFPAVSERLRTVTSGYIQLSF